MILSTEKQSKMIHVLLVFCIFSIMFDSGGELGIRTIGLILLIAIYLTKLKRAALRKNELFFWLILLSLLLPSILVGSIIGIEFSKMLIWIIPFLAFPLILLMVRANNINEKHFIQSGLIFSIIVIIIFAGRIFQIEPILELHYFISERTAGFFNEKAAYSEDAMPVVYFQGTLALVICAVFAAVKKNFFTYLIITIALFIAPSRTGTITSIVIGITIFLQEQRRLNILVFLFALPLISIIIYNFLPTEAVSFIFSSSEGLTTRSLHLESIGDLFSSNPFYFIFGNGPGSQFFTKGFGDMTNNIEISQLEVVRKYGIIFSSIFFSFYVAIILLLIAIKQSSIYLAMIAHFFVALSNPVLFSIPATFMFAMAIDRLRQSKTNNIPLFKLRKVCKTPAVARFED